MARSSARGIASLAIANVLLPLAVLAFASGFFPYKPVLPGLATFADVQESDEGESAQRPEAIFDRVIFMVVDALRSDFVYGTESGFAFTQGLVRSGAAIPFTAHATPPTVTMPRVKALTTGSVPSFLDLILNFAESDTSSSLATQDTWLAQLRAHGGDLVFYGDDTWLKLFPGDFFARSDGTSSFFVSDFTEVDNNVTRHLPRELARDDWHAMIMHYLGMDHIGHKTGPRGPNMLPKQREMDGIVEQIYTAIAGAQPHLADSLLVLAGDHGMNAGGNHGGSGPGETEPALLFASPKFASAPRRRQYECPTSPRPGTDFHFYSKLEQSDVVPTLAGLLGLPVPKNSLGVYIRELAGLWPSTDTLRLLRRNARQMLGILRAKYGAASFDVAVEEHTRIRNLGAPPRPNTGDGDALAQQWAHAQELLRLATASNAPYDATVAAEDAVYAFLHEAQTALSDTASSYDIPRMLAGIGVAAAALGCALASGCFGWASSPFVFAGLLYSAMMFASSYVEEEQHFWYWLTPAWITTLAMVSAARPRYSPRKAKLDVAAAAVLFAVHRVAVRWNQTGQKHVGAPDIVHGLFPGHHVVMWLLVWSTYLYVGVMLHNRTFAGLFMPELTAFADVALVVTAVVFKLNFTQADAPELVQDLAQLIRTMSEPFDLVFQARAIFAMLAVVAVVVIGLSVRQSRVYAKFGRQLPEDAFTLAQRLHPLLTLFLMTQTRATNVPLFLGLEAQLMALSLLLDEDEKNEGGGQATASHRRAIQVAASTLLLSHVYYFCMGGSNSISSIDLSHAYNGVADYNILAVGVLLFAGNWAGPLWWCSGAVLLMQKRIPRAVDAPQGDQRNGVRSWVSAERAKLRADAALAVKSDHSVASAGDVNTDIRRWPWAVYVAHMTAFVAVGLLAVMAACTALRTHLFIWTVFSPKYLYAMAWAVGWHLLVNIGLGCALTAASRVVS